MEHKIFRGDIYYADLNPIIGCEEGGIRPTLIIQNDCGNRYSPTVVIAAITSQINKKNLPTHILISTKFLPRDSIVLLEQIRTIDKSRLFNRIATLDNETMEKINTALQISVGL